MGKQQWSSDPTLQYDSTVGPGRLPREPEIPCHPARARTPRAFFFWFSRSRLPPNKLIAGCVTDDELVRAVITNGKYAGVAVGLVGVRSEGAFGVTIGNGVNPDVHWRYCTNFQRIDGWEWSRHGDEAVNVA